MIHMLICLIPPTLAAVRKHFDDINEDQFDFHGYCLRKVTLRSYVDVLRFEDKLFGEEFYVRASIGIIKIYLQLFDNPLLDGGAEPDYSSMTAVQRKKAKAVARKKKKAVEKKDADVVEATLSTDTNGSSAKQLKGGKPSFIDEDALGKELLAKDPLTEATIYSRMLTLYAPNLLDSWILRYDLAVRKKKSLMALQALHKARAIEPSSADVFTRIVDYNLKQSTFPKNSGVTKTIADEASISLLNGKSLGDFVKEASAAMTGLTTLALRTAVAKALVETQTGSVTEAAALIISDGLDSRMVNVDSCREALRALQSFGDEATVAVADWTLQMKSRFPLLEMP
jgi:hypothetical protein